MIIDCVSDLHGYYPNLTGGDLLIIAGDLTANDTEKEFDKFWRWITCQPYELCVVIAGNHDNFLQKNPDFLINCGDNIKYLCDSSTEFQGLKIYGSPWTSKFDGINPDCCAFTVDHDIDLEEKWDLIPDDTYILITHTPMLHILDQNKDGYSCGSYSLRRKIDKIQPKLHVCGHIHEQGDKIIIYKNLKTSTICINASCVDENYNLRRKIKNCRVTL